MGRDGAALRGVQNLDPHEPLEGFGDAAIRHRAQRFDVHLEIAGRQAAGQRYLRQLFARDVGDPVCAIAHHLCLDKGAAVAGAQQRHSVRCHDQCRQPAEIRGIHVPDENLGPCDAIAEGALRHEPDTAAQDADKAHANGQPKHRYAHERQQIEKGAAEVFHALALRQQSGGVNENRPKINNLIHGRFPCQ